MSDAPRWPLDREPALPLGDLRAAAAPRPCLIDDPTLDATFYYDTNPLDTSGQPLTYMYSYNTAGRVIEQRMEFPVNVGPGQYPTQPLDASYTWDNQGRLTQMIYPTASAPFPINGPTYNYSYDAMSNLSAVNNTTCGICIADQRISG